MSRPSAATPLPGTPILRFPSPGRTPSPLPLFSKPGPYTYTGQITRKYASRFAEINKTRNSVKEVEGAWEKEAKERGIVASDLMKNSEVEDIWGEKYVSRVEQILLQKPTQVGGGQNETNNSSDESTDVVSDKRMSLEGEQFVDALTSPLEKPKDWGYQLSQNDVD